LDEDRVSRGRLLERMLISEECRQTARKSNRFFVGLVVNIFTHSLILISQHDFLQVKKKAKFFV
jgi:hypothetical protein